MKATGWAGLLAAALLFAAPMAQARGIGVGAYGGASIPVLQDDATQGSQYGIRVPVHMTGMLALEPFYESSALGDAEEDFGGVSYSRDGGDMTRFGLNALFEFGTSFVFYPYGGISQHSYEKEGSDTVDELGFNAGIGLGFSIPVGLRFDIRSELDVIPTDDTSRKFANINVGVSYNLFKTP